MDKKKLVAAFKKQSDKLNEKDFDLDSWKAASVFLFSRTFGDMDSKTKALQELKIDYSSWALRDAPSTYDPKLTCKKMANEIIMSAIQEIELFGLPDETALQQLMEEVYSEEEMKQIVLLSGQKEKSAELKKLLDKAGKEKSIQVLAGLLLVDKI